MTQCRQVETLENLQRLENLHALVVRTRSPNCQAAVIHLDRIDPLGLVTGQVLASDQAALLLGVIGQAMTQLPGVKQLGSLLDQPAVRVGQVGRNVDLANPRLQAAEDLLADVVQARAGHADEMSVGWMQREPVATVPNGCRKDVRRTSSPLAGNRFEPTGHVARHQCRLRTQLASLLVKCLGHRTAR